MIRLKHITFFFLFFITIPFSMVNSILISYGNFNFNHLNIYSSILFCFFVIITYLKNPPNLNVIKKQNAYLIFTLFLMFSLQATVIFFHTDVVSFDAGRLKSSGEYHIPIFFIQIIYIFIGYYLLEEASGDREKYYVFSFGIFISFFYFFAADITAFKIYYTENKISYLFIGDFCAILFLIGYSFSRRYKNAVFLFGLFTLFLISSRSSFYIYLITFFFYLLYAYLSLKSMLYSLLFFLILILLFFIFENSFLGLDYVFNTDEYRILRVFEDSDSSKQGRALLNEIGNKAVFDNWFLGDFGGQTQFNIDGRGARWGQYIHNLMSVWRQFGFLTFVVYISILSFSIYKLFLILTSSKRSPIRSTLLLVGGFSIFSVVISRAYTFTSIYFFFGLLIFYIAKGSDSENAK